MTDSGDALDGRLSGWKQKIVVFAGTLGAPGLFLISFLDSSVLTFPVINDLLLVELSIQHPARMALYALMAALGSVLGCVLLYFIARKGGEAVFRKRAGARAEVIRHWVEKNGFGGMLIAALLPPPTPFKVFVFAAGVFEVPRSSFTAAISLARLIRYFGVGYLAVKLGNDPMPFLRQHIVLLVIGGVLFVTVSYGLSRWILRERRMDAAGR
jgi:membrane protein YqaA with SNARE-associated domain